MAQSNTRLSPRQKMINLMYIVLTAMLALNVSSDVLDGFKEVEDGLARTNETASDRNSGIYGAISAMALQNPERAIHGWPKPQPCAKSHSVFMTKSTRSNTL